MIYLLIIPNLYWFYPCFHVTTSSMSREAKLDPRLDEVIKCVTSSDLDKLKVLTEEKIPIIPEFPLCGKWRKNITLLHLAAAYGSLTCIQYFLDKIDINSLTDDKVC